MIREEAIEILEKYKIESEEDYYVKRAEAIDMAIKTLQQQPCDDCISRQAVNDLQKYRYNCGDTAITCVSLNSINELPPVTPQPNKWIPCSEDLPELNEEAYSNDVLISLKRTTFDIDKCQMVHITKIAFYDRSAISSDGRYMDTEGWVLKDGGTLSMDEVIAWMPLPEPYKAESEEHDADSN